MKTINWPTFLAALAVSAITFTAAPALAQGAAPAAPPLPAGVQEILRLEQAKISDDVVIAYVKNSPKGYGLTADQIIYLRQQGISNPVITAMLNQGSAAPTPPEAAAATTSNAAPVQTAAAAPAVTYVPSAPATTVYYTQPYYYQPYPVYGYGWYPPVSVSLGWGWGWGWGWHHGWRR